MPPSYAPPKERWSDPAAQVTLLLVDLKNGDPQAIDRLIPIVYDELRRLAAHYLRDEHAAGTLQPTVLVHEADLKLVAQDMPDWESRSHFFGVAAHLMRQILVDHARRHTSQKVEPSALDTARASSAVPSRRGGRNGGLGPCRHRI